MLVAHCVLGVITDVLDGCKAEGTKAAEVAVVGACAVLTRKCPVIKTASRTPPTGPTFAAKSLPGRWRFKLQF